MRSRVAAAGAVVAAVAIVIAATLPESRRSLLHSAGVLHPYLHLAMFCLVAWLSAWSTRSAARRVVFCIGIVLLGCATEYVEFFLYHGALEWTDMVLDSIGAVAGTSLGALTMPRENFRW